MVFEARNPYEVEIDLVPYVVQNQKKAFFFLQSVVQSTLLLGYHNPYHNAEKLMICCLAKLIVQILDESSFANASHAPNANPLSLTISQQIHHIRQISHTSSMRFFASTRNFEIFLLNLQSTDEQMQPEGLVVVSPFAIIADCTGLNSLLKHSTLLNHSST
nr:hypothetical protein Iba_chr01aCG2980 [Ipomoea batatas]